MKKIALIAAAMLAIPSAAQAALNVPQMTLTPFKIAHDHKQKTVFAPQSPFEKLRAKKLSSSASAERTDDIHSSTKVEAKEHHQPDLAR